MSELAVAAVDAEFDEDEPVEWRRRPPMLPLLAAAGGGLVMGIGAGIGGALLVAFLSGEPVEEPIERTRVVQDVGTIKVNLRGDDGERVLTVRAEVEVDAVEPDQVETLVPVLRDGVLVLASDHTAEELLARAGRARFRSELQDRLALFVGSENIVQNVFITELVVK